MKKKLKIMLGALSFMCFVSVIPNNNVNAEACNGSREKNGKGASTYEVGNGFCCDCDADSDSCSCGSSDSDF